jgi:hypothetical protein
MNLGAIHICSFYDGTYRAMTYGREVIFEWSDRFSPLFVNREGETLKSQAWRKGLGDLIHNWERQGKRVCRNCGYCLWRPEDQAIARHVIGNHWMVTRYVVFQDDRCGCPDPQPESCVGG